MVSHLKSHQNIVWYVLDNTNEHERNVTHFQNMILAKITIYFSEKAKAEETEQGWKLVERKNINTRRTRRLQWATL